MFSHINFFSVQAYAVEAREDWVKDWPGQVVLAVSQIYWTEGVHEFIVNGPAGLKEYYNKLQEQLTDIVQLVSPSVLFTFCNLLIVQIDF